MSFCFYQGVYCELVIMRKCRKVTILSSYHGQKSLKCRCFINFEHLKVGLQYDKCAQSSKMLTKMGSFNEMLCFRLVIAKKFD